MAGFGSSPACLSQPYFVAGGRKRQCQVAVVFFMIAHHYEVQLGGLGVSEAEPPELPQRTQAKLPGVMARRGRIPTNLPI